MTKTIITLDSSQIATHMTCNMKWWLAYHENLRLAVEDTEAMDMGSCVHKLLELFYAAIANGETRKQAAERAVTEFRESNYCEKTYNFPKAIEDFIITRFGQYYLWYEGKDFEPIRIKDFTSVELGFSKVLYENDYVMYVYEGRIDIISRHEPERMIWWDHKSQDRASTLYPLKPQFLTYAVATELEYGGVNYFGLQKEMNQNTFRRQLISIPQWMRERWKQQMLRVFQTVHAHIKSGVEYVPMNLNSCAGAFDSNPCQFTYLCETQSKEMREQLKQFKYKKVQPWRPWE